MENNIDSFWHLEQILIDCLLNNKDKENINFIIKTPALTHNVRVFYSDFKEGKLSNLYRIILRCILDNNERPIKFSWEIWK